MLVAVDRERVGGAPAHVGSSSACRFHNRSTAAEGRTRAARSSSASGRQNSFATPPGFLAPRRTSRGSACPRYPGRRPPCRGRRGGSGTRFLPAARGPAARARAPRRASRFPCPAGRPRALPGNTWRRAPTRELPVQSWPPNHGTKTCARPRSREDGVQPEGDLGQLHRHGVEVDAVDVVVGQVHPHPLQLVGVASCGMRSPSSCWRRAR